MKSFKMEIELASDACAADAWAMAQLRLADIGRVVKVVDVASGEFVKPLRATPHIVMTAGKVR